MRLTVRSIGFMLVALGAWGAIVPFVGPEFDYPFPAGSDVGRGSGARPRGSSRCCRASLRSTAGSSCSACVGSVRFAPAFGALIALTCRRLVRPRLRVLPTLDDSAAGRHSGSDWMVIATNLGYHEGLGLTIVALSAFALGMLALLPERATQARGSR